MINVPDGAGDARFAPVDTLPTNPRYDRSFRQDKTAFVLRRIEQKS